MYENFNGSCLEKNKITFNHGKIVNIYTVCDLESTFNYNTCITLENCLFGAVKITKNAVVSKYKYFGCRIGIDGKGAFSHSSGSFGNNAIIVGVDMSSSVHVDNKKKDTLFLGKGHTQGLDGTTLTAEKMYSISFAATRKKFCLGLHYNGHTQTRRSQVLNEKERHNIKCLGL